MVSGKFESLTRRSWITSWNPESQAILCNFMFSSLLFVVLFQVWNKNYYFYYPDITHPGSETSSEYADYLRMIKCLDIVDHNRPFDLNGSSVAEKSTRTLTSKMGNHTFPLGISAIKFVGRYLIPCHICNTYMLYLLVFSVLNMSFKQSFASTVTKIIKNS